MSALPAAVRKILACKCPRCGDGALYAGWFGFELRDECPACGLDYTKSDTADGPAVFLVFLLGTILVPAALIVEALYAPPLWVHIAVWSVLGLGMTFGLLKPAKAYVVYLQYKHRPWDKP